MPIFTIATNLTKDAIPQNFMQHATTLISEELGKPESIILVQVCPDQVMTFGASSEPCANISLSCIGVVGAEKNQSLAPILCNFIEQQLGIRQDRLFIAVHDVPPAFCIWNGSTFE